MDHATTYTILASVFGFFMAWGIGANDVANAMGTSVGSKALTIGKALLIAAIFESAGAMLAGGEVTNTIRNRIVDPQLFSYAPELFVYGMLAALLAAGTWLLVASCFGWPVSTTHSIVGAIIGFAVINIGPSSVEWSEVIAIVASWVVTPIISGIIAYAVFQSIQRFIFNASHPIVAAKRLLPIYIGISAFIIALVTLFKGIKHIGVVVSFDESIILATGVGVTVMLLGYVVLRNFQFEKAAVEEMVDTSIPYAKIEKLFAVLMVFTASTMAFAHGSNDVANAIGPLAAIVSVVKGGGIASTSLIPAWILLLGAVGIVLGLATYGFRVIATVGSKITELTPSRGFAAEFATATTIVIASGTGLPVSTTQTLVGAILGVGFARGIGALNVEVIRNIFMSWVITLPMGALLAAVFFYIMRYMFG